MDLRCEEGLGEGNKRKGRRKMVGSERRGEVTEKCVCE